MRTIELDGGYCFWQMNQSPDIYPKTISFFLRTSGSVKIELVYLDSSVLENWHINSIIQGPLSWGLYTFSLGSTKLDPSDRIKHAKYIGLAVINSDTLTFNNLLYVNVYFGQCWQNGYPDAGLSKGFFAGGYL